jgi:type I restriction enzyme S subunit
MALCDRLEAQQQEREAQAGQLARASLVRFTDAPTPANLNRLFHSSFTISPSDLRKSILTLAVQGKLVPQDPDDEPAEELLASLEQERPSIAKEQGVRLPKNVPSLTADNFPHDIPDSWQWSRIGNLALVIDYGTSQKAGDDSLKVPVYRMGNIVGGRLVDENLKYVDSSIDDLPRLYLKTDDLLFNRTNSYELVGKAGMFTGRDATATFASYLIRIRLSSTFLFPNFFSIAMNAPYFRQTQIEPEVVQQCGQANFNGTKLASTVVPVPPLAEQRRIVAKVSELMALVDELETQLAASRAAAEKLLSALVAELTGTTSRLPADS